MKPEEAVTLYNRYIGDWGGASTSYRFEAVKNGEVVKTMVKEPVHALKLSAEADHDTLTEENTYDVAAIRIRVLDEHDNQVSFFQEPVQFEVEGPIALIGPEIVSLQGGMGGTYVRTLGEAGEACLKIRTMQAEEVVLHFTVL